VDKGVEGSRVVKGSGELGWGIGKQAELLASCQWDCTDDLVLGFACWCCLPVCLPVKY
jgi:hypothetical protein